MSKDNFVTVKTFSQLSELTVIRARLEAEAIECFVPDELTIQVGPYYGNALGGVRLQVRETDVEAAKDILKDAGYVEDVNEKPSKFFVLLDKITLQIPLIKTLRYELRIIFTGALLIFIILIGFYFWSLPTKYELLTKNNWCISFINYDGKEYHPNTAEIKFIMDNDCNETVVFNRYGVINLPGFNSRSIDARWHLNFGRLEISASDTFDFVYNGTYKIEHSDRELILESSKTTIHCYSRFSEYSLFKY